jgi:hypothetical protein
MESGEIKNLQNAVEKVSCIEVVRENPFKTGLRTTIGRVQESWKKGQHLFAFNGLFVAKGKNVCFCFGVCAYKFLLCDFDKIVCFGLELFRSALVYWDFLLAKITQIWRPKNSCKSLEKIMHTCLIEERVGCRFSSA